MAFQRYSYLLILLVATVMAVSTTITQDALGFVKSSNTLSPVKSYGMANAGIVCGDRLCSEPKPEPPKIIQPNSTESIEDLIAKFQLIKLETNATKISNYTAGKYNIPVTLDLHKGFFEGKLVYSIITDTNSTLYSDLISSRQNNKAQLAPGLGNFTSEKIPYVYWFRNGVEGDGVYGFQGEVYSTTPSSQDYLPVARIVDVEWKPSFVAKVLPSEREINEALKDGQVTKKLTNVFVNMPQIVWPGGQVPVKQDKQVSDKTPYTGGQIINLDLDKKTITFISRLNWINGNQSYYIITDAIPLNPANAIGVNYTPMLDKFFNNTTTRIYHFMNGVSGPGAYGFQPGLFSISENEYSGYCSVYAVKWADKTSPKVIKGIEELNDLEAKEKLVVLQARPMNSNHLTSCLLVEPFS